MCCLRPTNPIWHGCCDLWGWNISTFIYHLQFNIVHYDDGQWSKLARIFTLNLAFLQYYSFKDAFTHEGFFFQGYHLTKNVTKYFCWSTFVVADGWSPIMDCMCAHHIIISYHIVSYRITSHHILSYHIISYHLYHIISYHIISYHIISYHIISYHIISYHKTCPKKRNHLYSDIKTDCNWFREWFCFVL